ncbi:MAG: hypothetical protein ACT4P7_02340 [Gemmatimonadaceae bacterium]
MPNHILTLYNCGTAYHRNSGDTVSKLYGLTLPNERFVSDGVGSGSLKPNRFGGRPNPGGATKLGGLLFGVGMDANVAAAVHCVRDSQPRRINMCGWSRGGVTCTKISKQLYLDPALRHIPVNIFAIDPVPGSAGPAGNHAWKQIELTGNVENYYVVFAQHDSRAAFAPSYPNVSGSTTVTVEIMPGSHSVVAEEKPGLEEAAQIVYDLAKRFLQLHGTSFTSKQLLTASELINRYAKVQIDFGLYREKAKPDPGWLKRKLGISPDRTIKDDKGTKIGEMRIERVGFFVNEHHRDLFQAKYFYLTQELDKDPADAFRHASTSAGWVRETLALEAQEPTAYTQLAYHIRQLLGS